MSKAGRASGRTFSSVGLGAVVVLSAILLPGAVEPPGSFGPEKVAAPRRVPKGGLKRVSFYWDVWGIPSRIRIDGRYAYIPMGESDQNVQIVDISDPLHPSYAGGLRVEGWTYVVEVKDDVVYAAPRGSKEVVVYDVSEKGRPRVIRRLRHTHMNPYPVLAGDLLAVWSKDTRLYEVKDARRPKLLCTLKDVEIKHISGGTAWGRRGDTLLVFDISDPSEPRELYRMDLNGGRVLGTVGDYLYIGRGPYILVYLRDRPVYALKVYNFKEPIDPDYRDAAFGWSWAGDSGYQRDFQVVGDRAYFVCAAFGFAPNFPPEYSECAGLWVLDVSDPAEPKVIGRWGAEYARRNKVMIRFGSVQVRGNFAFVSDELFGMRVLDVSDPASIKEVAEYKCGGEMCCIRLGEGRAYVSEYLSGGITVFDIGDPARPRRIGYLHTGGYVYKFVVYKDSYIYFSEETEGGIVRLGLGVMDIRDLKDPHIVHWENEWVDPVAVAGDYLLAGSGIYSLKDPAHPRHVADLAGPGTYVASGNYVYWVQSRKPMRYNNFKVIDISDPANPEVVAALTIGGDDSMIYRHMEIVGDRLYVGSATPYGDPQITEIYIGDPAHPKVLGEYNKLNSSDSSYHFFVRDRKLYTFRYYAGRKNGVVYDIGRGLGRAKVIQKVPGFYTWDLAVYGDFVYVVRLNGLEVFEIKGP